MLNLTICAFAHTVCTLCRRFPVHFMGGSVHDNSAAEDANYGNGDSGGNMARQRSGRTGAVAGASSGPARGLQHQHQKQQQVLPGTALGRRLAGEVSDAGSFDDEICDGKHQSICDFDELSYCMCST